MTPVFQLLRKHMLIRKEQSGPIMAANVLVMVTSMHDIGSLKEVGFCLSERGI